jgi:NTP pyrophosphatase (non-canonical NTP hydrolase)
MEIKDMQKQMWNIIEERNRKAGTEHDKELTFVHIVEEIGELARELYNKRNNLRKEFNKEKFDEELIDSIAFLLILAKDYDVNLEETFNKKIQKLKKRFELE